MGAVMEQLTRLLSRIGQDAQANPLPYTLALAWLLFAGLFAQGLTNWLQTLS